MQKAPISSLAADRFVPKYVRLKQEILELINQLAPGEGLPPIATLRKRYKVSQPTVDRAIQELRSEGLLDSRRGSGVYVTPMAKVKRIGVLLAHDVLESGISVFECRLLQALQDQTRSGEHLLRHYLGDRGRGEQQVSPFRLDLEDGRLDGLISIDGAEDLELLELLNRSALPAVSLSHAPSSPHRIVPDYTAMVRMGLAALAGRGCRKIALFGHDQPVTRGMEVTAFEELAAPLQLELRPEWTVRWTDRPALELLGYREFIRHWSSWQAKPEGLLCLDDNVTVGVLQAAHELGVRLDEELVIASHANHGLSRLPSKGIIRVEFDPEKIAGLLLERLENLMAGETLDPDPLLLAPELVTDP